MAVDQELLNRGGGQSSDDEMASRLMQDKNQARVAAGSSPSSEEQQSDFSQYSPLAQMGSSVIRRERANQSSGTGQKDPASASSATAKISAATSALLKSCWEQIIFFSFGTSIIWIDIHVLMSLLLPKMFCKLGHEWIPAELQKASPQQAESFGEKLALVENGACCCVNGCCGMIAISVIAVMATILGVYNSTIGKAFGWIYTLGVDIWNAVTGG